MPNFLTQIQGLDSNNKQTARSQLEPRRVRRQKAREAVKDNKSAQEKAG